MGYIKNVFAEIMTADVGKATKWYASLFDRKSDYNPMKILHEWDFTNGGVLQLVDDKYRAGSLSLTLLVGDIEKTKKKVFPKRISNRSNKLNQK